MKWEMEKGPNLLAYRTETIMLDLIKVEHPNEVLMNALAQSHESTLMAPTISSTPPIIVPIEDLETVVEFCKIVETDSAKPIMPSPMIMRVRSPMRSTR